MRNKLILASLLWCVATPATAQVSIGIRTANVSIGINLPVYPQLVRVPGYPVYYAPDLNSNYFFYDGLYWVYQDDYWYQSDWYNGPWDLVEPIYVPEFVLRIPVRYYRLPPRYFISWQRDAAPRWGERWGNDWSRRRNGWDQWDRNAVSVPAPLPIYQRQYNRDSYPQVEQQRELQTKNYDYRPRAPVVRQAQPTQRTPVTSRTTREPSTNSSGARRTERIELQDPSPQRGAPVRENTQRQQPNDSSIEASSPLNDKAQQSNKKQNSDNDSERNKERESNERNERGNRNDKQDR